MNFTKKSIAALPEAKKGKRYYRHDNKIRGLCIAVFPSGTKTFMLYRKINGKPVRIKIGDSHDLTVEQARNKAEQLNNDIAHGHNPQEAINAKKQEMTLDKFFALYMEKHAIPYKKAAWFDREQYLRHIQKFLGSKKLSAINRSVIQSFHASLGQSSGKTSANRVIDIIASIFSKAIEWGHFSGENPAKIKKFRLQSRDRFLTAEEMPRFLEALMQENNTTLRDYILLSLLTGARKSNVLAMRWDQINLNQAEWRIPETKNGEAQRVVLADRAREILSVRRAQGNSPWVFPGSGKTGHLLDPKKGWQRLLQRAELQDVRIHDLRRTLGSWQAAQGTSGFIIGKSLGHKSLRATEIYARLNLDPVRKSVEKATQAMMASGTNDTIGKGQAA